jgi:glycosyltransferase involved in cell wall biosynthesis
MVKESHMVRILFLSRWFPYPSNNGSKLRIYNLLRGLAQHQEVTLLSFADQSDVDPNVSELKSFCRDVQVVPWKPFDPHSHRAWLGFLSLKPRSVIDTFSPEMRECINQTLLEKNYDVVIASQVDTAAYSQYFRDLPALFEEVEVGVLYEQFTQTRSFKPRLRAGLTWLKHRRYLASLLKNFQVCTVVSEQERQYLSRAVNSHTSIEVIPNCVNLTSYSDVQETPQPNTLIFTGAFSYFPNYEAMAWFLRKAYPLIQAQVPDVHLTITGNHQNRPLPPATNVTLTGFVDDVRPLIARSWASVVPLHTGGGTRLKILEAMALGTPVVATSKGAEGLDVQDGKHLLIADTPEMFAQAVTCLLMDAELRRLLSTNAYQLVREKYDWAVVIPRFLDLIERITLNQSDQDFEFKC